MFSHTMSAWWGKKFHSSRKKKEQQAPITDGKGKSKSKSFDETIARNSAKKSNFDTGSFSGFDSDIVLEKQGHPLPRPSVLTALSPVHDQQLISGSISSVSSSGSSDDRPDVGFVGLCRYLDPTNTPRGRNPKPNSERQEQIAERHLVSSSPFREHSKFLDVSTSPRSEFLTHGSASPPNASTLFSPRASVEIDLNPRPRSPCPGSRGHTSPTSPLHPRVCGFSAESSMEKQEDVKSRCHPLPLPPSSPNSHSLRKNGSNDTVQGLCSRWKKGKLLGRGTFGHVYVGFDSENGSLCAIKEVKVISDDQNSEECLRQLNQEISLLSQLLHPNIVQYYGSELAEGTLSVYLEYVSGGSIQKLLQEYGPFTEPVIQNYTRQILSGLAYLHERNTLHRDIKGANILVDPNGRIKLADFGMAKHITSCSSMLSFKGSPYWMAPEVAAIFKIANSKDIPDIPDHISDDGKSFLRLCLQRDPSARPSAAQLMEHPFIRDQSTAKVAKINTNRDSSQSSIGSSCIQNMTEFPRKNFPSYDGDNGTRYTAGFLKTFKSSSDQVSARMNLSLPVSPCSSPLRHLGPAHKSCFLSPPHPVYTMGISHDGLVHHSVSSGIYPNTTMKLTVNYPDPWPDNFP
ncbi:mitogen-activated protein kinase kinase kinase 3-like isoform X2 [Magnolia sinica]|uniref:mitogen-activated protein kinase kinase kinase 3-like isoform X2 n=1 Tax=Magnolia sinica TaxID=86752 RepID=UPI002659E2C0|nr:mitogen-activated protein kinase kinase kinase 3-like isoform X2 [Magnolia sinica]